MTKQGHRLSDVIAVAQTDQNSTLKRYGGSLAGATIAKTGSVDRAKTLAGAVSTKDGLVYFVVLVNMHGMGEAHSANNMIKDKIRNLISRFHGPSKINYNQLMTLPFDKGSVLLLSPVKVAPKG